MKLPRPGPVSALSRFWPASALLSWALAWLLAGQAGWLAGFALGLLLALLHRRPWRRVVVALGLPLAALLTGVPLPAWSWLAAAALLLLLYPWWLWHDAPLFLTPARAFDELPALLSLPAGSRLIDAGCGSGAALRAWHRAYPELALHGVEASWPLVFWARLRCPFARVRQGDFWADDWGGYDLVYLFQRPESMAEAGAKARRELRPGSWVLSLDFPLADTRPLHELALGRHRLFVYSAENLNRN